MKLRRSTVFFVLVLASLSTGCFGLFGSHGTKESATISVVNDMQPSDDMSIEIRRNGGDQKKLGTVPAGVERALTYESSDLQGSYQLVARQSSGAALVSREFTLFAGARVRWDMQANSVTVTQSR